MDNTLISRAVVQNEFRTAGDLVDRVGGGAGGGVKAVAPTGNEPITITIPEEEEEVSLLGEKLTVERLDGADLTQVKPDAYDLIVVEGAVGRAPDAWLKGLALGGRLGVVERDGAVGQAVLYVRAEDGVGRRDLFDAFPPVNAGFALQHGFAL